MSYFNSINRMTCGICLPPVTLDEMFKDCIIHSYSRAWQLGRCVMRARISHSNVVQAIAKQQNGILLLTGKVNSNNYTLFNLPCFAFKFCTIIIYLYVFL